jgi:hypothetical protein
MGWPGGCLICNFLRQRLILNPLVTLPPWPSDALLEAVMRACAAPPARSGILRPRPPYLPHPRRRLPRLGGGAGSLIMAPMKGFHFLPCQGVPPASCSHHWPLSRWLLALPRHLCHLLTLRSSHPHRRRRCNCGP